MRVQAVGLGELAGSLRIVSNLSRVDNGDLEAALIECRCRIDLELASSFEDDAFRLQRREQRAESLDARLCVRYLETLIPGDDVDVQRCLRDVNTDEMVAQ